MRPSRSSRGPTCAAWRRDDWDERVADLQYRDVCEFAVGHGVATRCRTRRRRRLPRGPHLLDSRRPRSSGSRPRTIEGVELAMEALAALPTATAATAKLGPFVTQYRAWIDDAAAKRPPS